MKLVLFDLDGTLVSTGEVGKSGLDRAIENLFGKKPKYPFDLIVGNTDVKNFYTVFEHVFGRKIKEKEFEALKKEYLKVLPAEVEKEVKKKGYKVVKGAAKLLETLSKNKNIRLALGTGNIEEAAFIKLAPSGLDKYFKVGGWGTDSQNRAEMLRAGVKRAEKFFKTKFKAEDVFVIGDTHKDVVAAKENGYHTAVVRTWHSDAKLLNRAAAELDEKDFSDIENWLLWLNEKTDPKGVKRGSYIMPASAIEHVFFSRTGIDEDRLKMLRIKKYEDLPSGKIF